MKEKMKEFELYKPIEELVFKIPVNIKWKCCVSGDVIDTSFLEIHVKTYMNYTVEFIQLVRHVIELFKKKVESCKCTIAEEIVTFIKDGLEEEYPLHEFTVKLMILEKEKETGTVFTVEVIA